MTHIFIGQFSFMELFNPLVSKCRRQTYAIKEEDTLENCLWELGLDLSQGMNVNKTATNRCREGREAELEGEASVSGGTWLNVTRTWYGPSPRCLCMSQGGRSWDVGRCQLRRWLQSLRAQ